MDKIYIVRNSEYDGYREQFWEMVPEKEVVSTFDELLKKYMDGSLHEGDIIYECTVVGEIKKELKLSKQ